MEEKKESNIQTWKKNREREDREEAEWSKDLEKWDIKRANTLANDKGRGGCLNEQQLYKGMKSGVPIILVDER